MNESLQTSTDDLSPALLDRLVDGELTEAERRQLLSSLDVRPEGWRRCALAFLEAQTWHSELRLFARKAAAETAPVDFKTSRPLVPIESKSSPTSSPRFRWSTLWAMAASFLLAFTGVLLLRGDLRFRPAESVERLATDDAARGAPDHRQALAAADGAAPAAGPATITVALPTQDGVLKAMQMPVFDENSLDALLAGSGAEAVPPSVIDYVRKSGREIKQERQLVPIDFQDGRRGFVPLDRVRIVPAKRDFQ